MNLRSRSLVLCTSGLLFTVGITYFARGEASIEPTWWSVEDYLRTESVGDMRLAPDGTAAVWEQTAYNEESGKLVTQLYYSEVNLGEDAKPEPRQLTHGDKSCNTPAWSPDGSQIAFLSDRPNAESKDEEEEEDEVTRIWILPMDGGEATAADTGEQSVSQFQWVDDDTIAFVADEKETWRQQNLEEEEDDSVAVEDTRDQAPARLYYYEIEEESVVLKTPDSRWISTFTISPTGKHAVIEYETSLSFEYDHKVPPEVFIRDMESGVEKRILADRRDISDKIEWSPDGKGFYVGVFKSSDPVYVNAGIEELAYVDAATGKESLVPLDWERALSVEHISYDPAFEAGGDGVLALLADGVRNKTVFFHKKDDTWTRQDITGKNVPEVFDIELSADGKTFLYFQSNANQPGAVKVASLKDGELSKDVVLSDANSWVKEKENCRAEVMTWKGALDEQVEGILYYPIGYVEGKEYPLIVDIHGGPFAADFFTWSGDGFYAFNIYAKRGAFLLQPNYHGSSNYGLAFAESISKGHYYDYACTDIEKGIDDLVAKGLVDGDRIAVKGWSNGAILTLALITRSTRYKAASSGAGGAEWVSDWGACAFGASFSNYYLGATPLENPQLYRDNAPIFQFNKVRTPLIIFHGDKDTAVPTLHGWMQFRVMQQLGLAPVRFILLPDEEHGPKAMAHVKRKIEEELAWFDKYLFETPGAGQEFDSVMPDSPLAIGLAASRAAHDGEHFGRREQGVLVPETVALGNLRVGRFEVTLAQFHEFDAETPVPPGEGNRPVTGVTIDRVKAYCEWLSGKTSRKYRLPNEEEAGVLFESEGEVENTLDHWAGYEANPEDATVLQKLAAGLAGKAPLLKPVGFGASVASNPEATEFVFDLGGNAAEWTLDASGSGKASGGCAACPADSRQDATPPAEYIGFRVLEE